MKFVDSIEIIVKSGDGGSGMVSFRSARNKPKLGADGGDGGCGGDVIFVGTTRAHTLSQLRYNKIYYAQNGGRGGTNERTGARGEDLVLEVPFGTVIFDRETGGIVGEVLENANLDSGRIVVAKGGKNGLGNIRFVKSTHQAPQEATPGEKGKTLELRLELKLIADIGLAGFPNAGKSTLLSVISAARPKIADYPFTTLEPMLGVVDVDESSFTVADIPGLIEGASLGKGLGSKFLKHLERTSAIALIIDPTENSDLDVALQIKTLLKELSHYSPELFAKVKFLILAKSDLLSDEQKIEVESQLVEVLKKHPFLEGNVYFISSATRTGLTELKRALLNSIDYLKSNLEAKTSFNTEDLDTTYFIELSKEELKELIIPYITA